MKIDILEIVEDILVGGRIGGRNGEMAYIENNPSIAKLYRESGKTFKEFLKDVVNEAEENLVQPKKEFLEVVLGFSNLENYIKPEELKEIKEEKNNYEDSRRRLLNATAKITESLSKNPVFYSLENYHDDGRRFIYNLERRVWTGKIRISKLQGETLRTLNDVSL